jgi:Protein of unknown function (DUF2938)
MSTEASNLLIAALIGVGATVLLDLWSLFLKRAFQSPLPNFCLVGRWFSHMTEGRFRHASIATATQMPSECAVGWIAHYVIGAVYGLAFVAYVSGGWLAKPTFMPTLIFGVVTVLLPFFIMQPAFGLGLAASRAPNPWQARMRTLLSHTVFGIGLYVCAIGVDGLL